MQYVAEKWYRRLVFIKGFTVGCVLALFITGSFYSTYARVAEGECMVRHLTIMSALKEHVDSRGQIPGDVSKLALLEYTSGMQRQKLSPTISWKEKRQDLRYYPDAWGKPGRIILRSTACGSYVVTFGNGSLAVISYWDYKPEENQQDQVNASREDYHFRAPGVYGTLPWIVSFVLLIVLFFITTILERVIKRKIRDA